MNKVNSLKKNQDFKKVYKEGKNYWNRNLILYVRKNDLDYNRIGYSITKKIGNSVTRNRVRRRMKEIYRLNQHRFNQGYDVIIIPKKNTVDISYKELESAMLHILKLAGIKKVKGKNE